MDRRGALVSIGCGICVSVSGCIESAQSLVATDPPVTLLTEPTVTQFDDWLGSNELPENATATTLVQFGESIDSHWVIIIPQSDTSVETTITIRRKNKDPFYTETVSLSAETYAGFRFMDSHNYTIELSSENYSGAVDVTADFIDCNRSYQIVEPTAEDGIEVNSLTEELACGY